jgi:predicted nucleic acid binding AN1-type Zn finger protein
MVTVRRSTKPAAHPRPESSKSFAADSDYGICECAGCERQARTACPSCGGEHCLAHTKHPRHDSPA